MKKRIHVVAVAILVMLVSMAALEHANAEARSKWGGLTPEERTKVMQEDLQAVDLYEIAATLSEKRDPSTMTELERWLREQNYAAMYDKYGEQGAVHIMGRFADAGQEVFNDHLVKTAAQERAIAIIGTVLGISAFLAFAVVVWRRVRRLAPAAVERVVESSKRRERTKAQEELLMYKRLLDEGVLSEDEYKIKRDELKKLIL